jgi:hypothetical protein
VSRVLGDKSTPAPSSTPAKLDTAALNGTPGSSTAQNVDSKGLLPFPNPLDALIGATTGAASTVAGDVVRPVLTFVLYLVMATGGATLMLLGLVLLALSTKAGKDAAELGVVAAAPEAAPAVAGARERSQSSSSSSSGGVPRDPQTGLTPSQAATVQHRDRTRQDRISLAEQRRADQLAREKRARAERTRVRTARERERERDRAARVVGRNLGITGFFDPAADERPKPRRTSGQPLPDTPPF